MIRRYTLIRKYLEKRLEERGYTRSHEFDDYYRACRELIGETLDKFQKKGNRSAEEVTRMECAQIIMDYIAEIYLMRMSIL